VLPGTSRETALVKYMAILIRNAFPASSDLPGTLLAYTDERLLAVTCLSMNTIDGPGLLFLTYRPDVCSFAVRSESTRETVPCSLHILVLSLLEGKTEALKHVRHLQVYFRCRKTGAMVNGVLHVDLE